MGGKMIKIPEDVRDSIKDMRREGMSADKIKRAAKELGRSVSLGAIYQICKGVEKGKPEKEKLQPSLRAGERESKKAEEPQEIRQEIKELVDELHVSYVSILKSIREDLIRARARLQEKAGE